MTENMWPNKLVHQKTYRCCVKEKWIHVADDNEVDLDRCDTTNNVNWVVELDMWHFSIL